MPNPLLPPQYDLSQRLNTIERTLANLTTSPSLLNASTGQGGGNPGITIDGNGVHAFNSAQQNIIGMLTADGSITAYDTTGSPVVRLGPLTQTNPGHYGLEVLYNGSWAQVGAGNVDWNNITNKPSTFPPSAHTHPGTDITSSVAQATGSQYGYSNPVGGTSFYAMWVGNNSGYTFGTNTSSARYKTNVRRHRIHPERVLNLKPVRYEKTPNEGYIEYGLIAEQVLDAGVPELVQWMNGKVHGLRYDLLSVALLEVVKHQDQRIAALERGEKHTPKKPWHDPETKANNPPPFPEPTHPYTIKED